MALRVGKKDVKKSSYYVWFLGAQEARSATGARQALAALTRLEARAASTANPASPPTKVTLQVSGRGLKIVQNVAGRTVKHLLPADSVTEARSRGDAVVCILLLYNPATRCPLHAHAYRCDSEQTAQALCTQLRAIAGLGPEEDDEPDLPDDSAPSDIDSRNDVELPRYNENRSGSYDKRIAAHESRTNPRDARADNRDMRIDPRDPRIDPRDPRIDGREHIIDPRDIRHGSHENRVPPIEMRLAPEQEIVAEKLAAELRTRLAGREPLLLPPRDYDTNRRIPSAAPQVAAKRNARTAVVGSSAGSSGIGSDLAPSPERPHTSSEEDWGESTAYMLHEGYDVSLSPPRRQRSPSPTKPLLRAAGSVSPKDRFHVAKEKFMNLEREKINEELEKRAQMRRNLNNILSRGPLSPSDIKNERRYKWDDDDDELLERRPEMPRAVARTDHRDMWRNGRDERDLSRGRDIKEVRDFRDSRHYREERGSRELRDPLDMRDLRDQKPFRDEREYRESRDVREGRDYRDYKESKDMSRYARDIPDARIVKDSRETRDYKEPRDPREVRESREVRDPREVKEYKDVREYKETREQRDPREYKEPRDFKYPREYRDARDVRAAEEPRPSRDGRAPQLEKRFYEYKGERNDKYFDNRYNKHDSRSDDEGVESEKQFEEMRYVQHIEAPRRREPEPRSAKIEPAERAPKKEPVRDGRIELLEERQRQIESGRMGRAPPVEDRYDRSQDAPGRPAAESREWDPVRRPRAEPERARRDARARHSYAEPVARTRVGMATVAPF